MALGDVTARIVRSDGEEMTLGDGDWRILNEGLENWANLPYNVYSAEIPSLDGAVVTSKRVSSVDRTIIAECKGDDPDFLRALAIQFFNPRYTYEVHMTYRGRTRWCSGEQIGFAASEGNIYRRPQITWTILCPNPYMQSESNFGKDIAEVAPMFAFPWYSAIYPDSRKKYTNTGAVYSVHTFAKSIDVKNDGDVPSGMRIIIRATDSVKNPSIRLGDGYVRLIRTLQQGDIVELDVTSRPPIVTLNGQNAMHLIDRQSSILNLRIDVGTTTLEYDADDGYQNLSVSVYWNKQYLGI